LEALIREIELSAKFDSKHIVQVLGACLDGTSTICLIMELVEGGNLHQRIHDPRRPRMTLLEALEVRSPLPATLFNAHADSAYIERDGRGGGGVGWDGSLVSGVLSLAGHYLKAAMLAAGVAEGLPGC
jgi:hypothetical protein